MKTKNRYKSLKVETIYFGTEDIITTSGDYGDIGGDTGGDTSTNTAD